MKKGIPGFGEILKLSIDQVFQHTQTAVQGLVQEVGLELQSGMINMHYSINTYIRDKLEKTIKLLEQDLPNNIKIAMLSLAEEGWFFSLDMDCKMLFELKSLLEDECVDDVEHFLIGYFKEDLNSIEERIVKNFPHREIIIRSAFEAHRDGKYTLSIPTLLTQIDGICYDKTEKYYFIKFKGKPQTSIYMEKLNAEDIIGSSLRVPLTETLPINASQHQREDEFNSLNRHMVMHGESLNYGTEINGLKVISMIDCIEQLLSEKSDIK